MALPYMRDTRIQYLILWNNSIIDTRFVKLRNLLGTIYLSHTYAIISLSWKSDSFLC